MAWMEGGSADVVHTAVAALAMTAGGVYALHMDRLPVLVGVASATLLGLAVLPLASHVTSGVRVVIGGVTLALGLVLAWAARENGLHAAQVVRDVGWTVAVLGGWLVYSSGAALSGGRRKSGLDDAALVLWRKEDPAFGVKLSRRIVVGAQRHWVALVIETAWPEPRPKLVGELLALAAKGDRAAVAAIHERMQGKTGEGIAEARWELARIGCEVIEDAAAREDEPGDLGGAPAARFIVAAARVVRDDDEASRIFAALILPAIAHRA
jgi:hypothetical protein